MSVHLYRSRLVRNLYEGTVLYGFNAGFRQLINRGRYLDYRTWRRFFPQNPVFGVHPRSIVFSFFPFSNSSCPSRSRTPDEPTIYLKSGFFPGKAPCQWMFELITPIRRVLTTPFLFDGPHLINSFSHELDERLKSWSVNQWTDRRVRRNVTKLERFRWRGRVCLSDVPGVVPLESFFIDL